MTKTEIKGRSVNVGVIGTGYLGRFHAQKYAALDSVNLVGVVDVDKKRAGEIADEVGCRSYSSYKELIGKIDAASIVVPTPLHYEISKEYLENDIDLLIEKPMTITLEEADTLIELARSGNRIVQVGLLERFNPILDPLIKRIKNPVYIESNRLSTYKERGTDVSVVLDLMIHDIDIVSTLVASEIKGIQASGVRLISEHLDAVNARLEFANGCTANITASRIANTNERSIGIFQPDTYIAADFNTHEMTITTQNKLESGAGVLSETLRVDKGDALEAEVRSFVDAVMHRKLPEVTGAAGREALKTALKIIDIVNGNGHLSREKNTLS